MIVNLGMKVSVHLSGQELRLCFSNQQDKMLAATYLDKAEAMALAAAITVIAKKIK